MPRPEVRVWTTLAQGHRAILPDSSDVETEGVHLRVPLSGGEQPVRSSFGLWVGAELTNVRGKVDRGPVLVPCLRAYGEPQM